MATHTVTATPMSHYAPSPEGITHPSYNPKVESKGRLRFFAVPNYQLIGGAPQRYSQLGDRGLEGVEAAPGQQAMGPITDRGGTEWPSRRP